MHCNVDERNFKPKVPSSTLEKHGLMRTPGEEVIRCIPCSKNPAQCICTNRPYYKSTKVSPKDSRDLRMDMASKCAGCLTELNETGIKLCRDFNQSPYDRCRRLEKTSPYNKAVDRVAEAMEIKREIDKTTSEEIKIHMACAVLDPNDIIDLISDESDTETEHYGKTGTKRESRRNLNATTAPEIPVEANWRPENCVTKNPKITDDILIKTNTCRVYFESGSKGKDSRMVCCTCFKSVRGNNGCPCTYREGNPSTWHKDTELYCKFCKSALHEGKKKCNKKSCNYQEDEVKKSAKAVNINWVERTLKERSNSTRTRSKSTNSTPLPSLPNYDQNSTSINQSGASSAKKSKIEILMSTKTLLTETSIDQDFMPNSPLVSSVVSDHTEVEVKDEFIENQAGESTGTDIDLSGLTPELRKHVESLREMNQHLLCKNRSNEENIKTLQSKVEEKEKIANEQREIMCNMSRIHARSLKHE